MFDERFTTAVSRKEVMVQVLLAERLQELGDSEYPDNTYEEGVADTIRWLIQASAGAQPIDVDLYQDLIKEHDDE